MKAEKTVSMLMLGGAKRVSLARLLADAGKKRGLAVRILSYEMMPSVPIASVGKVILGKRWKDASVLDHLGKVIREEHVDIVLPFVDGAVEVASRLKELHPGVFVPVSSFAVSHAMFDKCEAAAVFEKEGIAIPETYTAGSCRFPAILKPREGSASKGIAVVHSGQELAEVSDLDSFLVQEYIADRDEYTVDSYVSAISGRVLCAVPRIRISTSGGEVDRTETRRNPVLIDESVRILEKLGFRGPVTLQFIYDRRQDRFLLMEINPRLGGGVVCSVLAGADIPGMMLEEAQGREASPCGDWRDGALMARYFSEVMFFKDE